MVAEAAKTATQGAVTLIKHVAGKRATLQYTFADEQAVSKAVIGKLYRSRRRAGRMYRLMTTLAEDVFSRHDELQVPQPIALLDDLHMVLLAYVEGKDLRNWINELAPFELTGRWLAQLHETPALDELKVRTVEHEVQKAVHWLDVVYPHVTNNLQTALTRTRGRMREAVAFSPTVQLRPIHRDYYYANVLSDGKSICVLDLDEMRTGDPALDVAHFIAHLDILSFRQTGAFGSYDAQAKALLAAYQTARPASVINDRLPLYAAYTFLKLAATEAGRGRPGWETEVRMFATRAYEEVVRLG